MAANCTVLFKCIYDRGKKISFSLYDCFIYKSIILQAIGYGNSMYTKSPRGFEHYDSIENKWYIVKCNLNPKNTYGMSLTVHNNKIALLCKEDPRAVHQFNPSTNKTAHMANLAARYDYAVLVSIPNEYFINEAECKALLNSLWGLTIQWQNCLNCHYCLKYPEFWFHLTSKVEFSCN